MEQPRQPYERPTIEDLGDLLALTAANSVGAQTDATFPAHTAVTSLTFSA